MESSTEKAHRLAAQADTLAGLLEARKPLLHIARVIWTIIDLAQEIHSTYRREGMANASVARAKSKAEESR